MMLSRRSLIATLATSLLLAVPMPAFAASGAEATLKAKQLELIELVKKDDKAKLDRAFDDILDYSTLAQESLGELWTERSAPERAEFQKLLTELVRAAYRKSIKRTLSYDVEYKGESKIEGGTLVRTVAKSRENSREEPISLDYGMHEVSGRFRIRDIVTDGASLVANYRNQFRRIVKQQGFPELLNRMRKKIDKGDTA
jgi:phospholipid transport system substrate-binding protein